MLAAHRQKVECYLAAVDRAGEESGETEGLCLGGALEIKWVVLVSVCQTPLRVYW